MFQENIIQSTCTVKDALIKLNTLPTRDSLTLFVVNKDNKLVGTLTDGDIRRSLINNLPVESGIDKAMNKNFKFLKKGDYSLSQINAFKKDEIDLIPFIDENGIIIKIIDLSKISTYLPIDAVLMAGGEGKRLKPLTDNTPKPLLKVGNKPILEYNVDRLISFGVDTIHLSVNYLSEQIKNYFGNGNEKNIRVDYVEEKEPYGTIGSVSLIKKFNHEHVLVMNSDLLTNIDFEDMFRFYSDNDADMAVACIPYQVSLPYGIVENKGIKVTGIKEKPTYTYYSNAGIYLIKKSMLPYIPEHTVFNATDLIETLINKGKTVVNYPVLCYWLDIGKHEDFIKAQEDIKHLKF